MKSDENTLVLFEEFGGNPSLVNFQTVQVGTACGSAYENKTMELSCNGKAITAIRYANFGETEGICGSFDKGSCSSEDNAVSIIEKECVGKEKCSVLASEGVFGSTNCGNNAKRLIVEAVC